MGELMHKSERKACKTRPYYKKHFDRRVKNLKRYNARDCVFIGNPQKVWQSREEKGREKQHAPVKLLPKKAAQYKLIRAAEHAVTIEVDGIHNVVSIDQIMLAHKVEKIDQQVMERTSDDTQSKQR